MGSVWIADDVPRKARLLEWLPARAAPARARSLLRFKGDTDDLDSAESIVVSLALTIEARDSTAITTNDWTAAATLTACAGMPPRCSRRSWASSTSSMR